MNALDKAKAWERAANDGELPASGVFAVADAATRSQQTARQQRAAVISLAWATRALERQLDSLERTLDEGQSEGQSK